MPMIEGPRSRYAHLVESAERVLVDRSRPSTALRLAERALRSSPRNGRAWIVKAKILRTMQRIQQALICLDEAVRWAPGLAEAHLERARIFLSKDDRRALREVRAALAGKALSPPVRFEGLFLKGHILANLGRDRDAANSFVRALQIRPHDTSLYWNLGECYLGLGRRRDALNCFYKAVRMSRRTKNIDETALWGHLEGIAFRLIKLDRPGDALLVLDRSIPLLRTRRYRDDLLAWKELAQEIVIARHRRRRSLSPRASGSRSV